MSPNHRVNFNGIRSKSINLKIVSDKEMCMDFYEQVLTLKESLRNVEENIISKLNDYSKQSTSSKRWLTPDELFHEYGFGKSN